MLREREREKRSRREVDVIGRLEVLDRRMCVVVSSREVGGWGLLVLAV